MLSAACAIGCVLAVATRSSPAGAQELPLQPTRTIRFTTTEGTWMSVDASPDGRSILFDLLGQLYTIPVGGGKATALTHGMAFNAQPRYSPDGRQIVFMSDRDGWLNVWIARADGSAPRQITHYHYSNDGYLTRGLSPEWTPDGRGIVVSERPDAREHRAVEYTIASAGPAKVLVDTLTTRGAAFGGDPRYVFMAVSPRALNGAGWQIARVDRQTRALTLVTTRDSVTEALRPAVSPDGRYLAYGAPSSDGYGLRIKELASAADRWLLRSAERAAQERGNDTRDVLPGSSFSADGRTFITAYGGKIWRIDVATGAASPIPFSVDVEQPVGPLVRVDYPITDGPFEVRAIGQPRFSPDGSRIAFTALDRVWVMALPSTGASSTPRRLTASAVGEFFPTWSPDGRYIAYTTWSDSAGGAIYRVRADCTSASRAEMACTPERLTPRPGSFIKPVYTGDGASLMAVRGAPDAIRWSPSEFSGDRHPMLDSLALVRIPAAGGEPAAVAPYLRGKTDAAESYWKPRAWVYGWPQRAAQPDRINVYTPGEGLVSMSADGSSRRTLIRAVLYQARLGTMERAFDVVMAPSLRAGVAYLWMSAHQAFFFTLPDSITSPLSIVLNDSTKNPPGVRVWQTPRASVDFVGWTPDSRPYYTTGSALYIGDRPVTGPVDRPPTYRRISIDIRVPRDVAAGTLVLRGGRVLTMRGTGREIIERGDVVVRNGRIAAVGAVGAVATPPGARIIDVTGKTVLPGYVDVHGHIGYTVAYGTHFTEEPRLFTELAYGITAIRDPSDRRGDDIKAYGERADAGDLVSPRLFTVRSTLRSQAFGDGTRQDLTDTRTLMRGWKDDYDSETFKEYTAGGRRTRQLVVMVARELGLTSTNEGARDMAHDLTMAIDGYSAVEHTMEMPQYQDVNELFARTGIIHAETYGIMFHWTKVFHHDDFRLDKFLATAKTQRFAPPYEISRIKRSLGRPDEVPPEPELRRYGSPSAGITAAGGCVAMGSHGDFPGIGSHIELWFMSKGGMHNYDVLRSATLCSARQIGHEKDFGSLDVGKLADLQVLDANPLDDIRNSQAIRYVMVRGRLYDANSLDEVWPRERAFPRQWWWNGSQR